MERVPGLEIGKEYKSLGDYEKFLLERSKEAGKKWLKGTESTTVTVEAANRNQISFEARYRKSLDYFNTLHSHFHLLPKIKTRPRVTSIKRAKRKVEKINCKDYQCK